MKNRTFYLTALLVSASMFILTSCDRLDRTNDEITSLDVEMSEDDAMAEDVYNTLDGMIDNELSDLESNNFKSTDLKSAEDDPYICKVVTVDKPDTTNFPKTITIDYGEGCSVVIKGDTITRKGKIQIVITDHWFVEGASRTVTFIDFFINDVQVEGTISVTNLGLNEDGNMTFEVKIEGGELTYNDTLVYTRNCHRYREWIRSNDPLNDSIKITGECSGINADGNEYQHQISNPILMIRCYMNQYMWTMVGGTVDMERNGNHAQLNFGNGTCDNDAVLTINGESREIKVHNRYKNHRRVFKRMGNN